MTNKCLTCQTRGCGGLQYDPYKEAWYCPIFNLKLVYDNKTTTQKNVNVNNGTGTGNPFPYVDSNKIKCGEDMTGFYKGKPITDGRYSVLIQWKKGCNLDGYDYTTEQMDFICGSWYEFSQGEDGQVVTTIDGGIDYKIIGWREIPFDINYCKLI